MMHGKRKRYSAQFKFKVALEAAKGLKTINALSSQYGVHPNQISQWKRHLLEEDVGVFNSRGGKRQKEQEAVQAKLYEQIG